MIKIQLKDKEVEYCCGVEGNPYIVYYYVNPDNIETAYELDTDTLIINMNSGKNYKIAKADCFHPNEYAKLIKILSV